MNGTVNPKILVASPIYSGKHYMFPTWYNAITKLDYDNYDWMVVDNSSNMSYVSKLRRLNYKKIYHVPRGGNSRLGIARASQFIRNKVLEEDYEYLLFIESDLIPPKDIIQKLLKHEVGVVGCVYEVGLVGSKMAPRRPLIYTQNKNEDGTLRLDMMDIQEAYDLIGTGLQRTPACGFGCTLIHKSILEKYEFKWDANGRIHSDMLFYWELFTDDVPVYVDTDIVIPHYNQNWANMKDY